MNCNNKFINNEIKINSNRKGNSKNNKYIWLKIIVKIILIIQLSQ